jgi:hypothetical protein
MCSLAAMSYVCLLGGGVRGLNVRRYSGIEDLGHANATVFLKAVQANPTVKATVASVKVRRAQLAKLTCPPTGFADEQVSVDVTMQIEMSEPPMQGYTEGDLKHLMSVQRLTKASMESVMEVAVPCRGKPTESETLYLFPCASTNGSDIKSRDVAVKTILSFKVQSIKLDSHENTWNGHGKAIAVNTACAFLSESGASAVFANKARQSLDDFLETQAQSRKVKLAARGMASPLQGRAASEIVIAEDAPVEDNIYTDLSEARIGAVASPLTRDRGGGGGDGGDGGQSLDGDEAASDGEEDACDDGKSFAGPIGEPMQRTRLGPIGDNSRI